MNDKRTGANPYGDISHNVAARQESPGKKIAVIVVAAVVVLALVAVLATQCGKDSSPAGKNTGAAQAQNATQPQLQLNINNSLVQASYSSGSGTTSLVFTYTIQAGQNDANGISINANSLSLNGGTIAASSGGTAANLAHAAVGDNATYRGGHDGAGVHEHGGCDGEGGEQRCGAVRLQRDGGRRYGCDVHAQGVG